MTYSKNILVGKSILLISPEYWGINFVSKHHYALELSKNNIVYFFNPPSEENRLNPVNENLVVIDYEVPIRGVNHFPRFARNWFNKYYVKKIKSLCKVKAFDIIWSFDPFRFQNLKIFDSPLSIYHAVDVHNTKLEREAIETADIVFSNSSLILKRLKGNDNCFKINHGLADHFKINQNGTGSKRKIIKAGYLGNLQLKHIDTKTFTIIIENNPDIEFHFIGPYLPCNLSDKTYHNEFIHFLKHKSNTILHGPVPSETLPKLLADYDMFIMCYSGDTNKDILSNSHKILEFLSTGKVIVSHFIDEYKNKPDLLEMANYNKDIPELFKKVVSDLEKYNSTDLQKKRKAFAYAHTYENIIKKIDRIIHSIQSPHT